MKSQWANSVRWWLAKEFLCEFRSKHGLFSSALFGFMTVVTAVFATFDQSFSPDMAAAFLCVALVFSAIVTVPRLFLLEEDQKTFNFARLIANSSTIYTGKTIFGVTMNSIGGLILATVFALMTQNTLARWDVLLGGSLIFAAGLALCLSLCSSLVIGAENRYVLAGVVALPLVLPLVFCGVGVLKFAFGDGSWGATSRNFIVLIGYSIGLAGLGPVLADAVWGNRRDPSPQQSPPYNGDEK